MPLPQIARELNVDAVVEGSVFRSGEQVRITAQLILVLADKHLWAESYEGNVRGTLIVQNQVARAIAEEIRIELTPREQAALKGAKIVNPEAYEAYPKGRYSWNRRTSDGLKNAVDYFNQANAKESKLRSGLQRVGRQLRSFGRLAIHGDARQRSNAQSFRAARKAVELDDSLGEAHASLAFCLEGFLPDFAAADSGEFQRAVELSPGYATAHHWYARHLSLMGAKQRGHCGNGEGGKSRDPTLGGRQRRSGGASSHCAPSGQIDPAKPQDYPNEPRSLSLPTINWPRRTLKSRCLAKRSRNCNRRFDWPEIF